MTKDTLSVRHFMADTVGGGPSIARKSTPAFCTDHEIKETEAEKERDEFSGTDEMDRRVKQ